MGETSGRDGEFEYGEVERDKECKRVRIEGLEI
jgi:hypothetical protein